MVVLLVSKCLALMMASKCGNQLFFYFVKAPVGKKKEKKNVSVDL